jgi:hypothetical protein
MDNPDHQSFNNAQIRSLLIDLKKAIRKLTPYFPDHIDQLTNVYLLNHEMCMSYCGEQRAIDELLKHIAGLRAYKKALTAKT